jgi:hypothetical protein
MTIRTIILGLPIALLAACGGANGSTHKLESGTYLVSGATSSGSVAGQSECDGFLTDLQTSGRTIVITVDTTGTTATINPLAAGATPDNPLSSVKINGNTLDQDVKGLKTIADQTDTCVQNLTRTFSGDLTDDNDVALTYTFAAAPVGSGCTDSNALVTPVTCTSIVHFLAKKQ